MAALAAGYKVKGATHDASLSDGARTWYFDFDDIILEDPTNPQTVLGGEGGGYWGDFESDHVHVVQDNFTGGRGRYDFLDDETAYFDSGFANTMIPGRVVPVGQIRFSDEIGADSLMPGATYWDCSSNVSFYPLRDGERKYAQFVERGTGYSVLRAFVWLRKVGNPSGSINIAVYANSGNEPSGAALSTATVIAASDVDEDTLSVLYEATMSTYALVASTTYWVGVWSSANDDDYNHWEVGVGSGASGTLYKESTDAGSSFATSAEQLYIRLAAAFVDRTWNYFWLEGAFYRVGDRKDGTADSLYINGDRGLGTAATTTTIVDSVKSWKIDVWDGAWVRVTKGTGKGQIREIASNTATALTVTPAWAVIPSTDSEYAIYATDEWQSVAITTDGVDKPVKSVTVFNNQALMGFGASQAMLRVKWDSTIPGHRGRDESGGAKADHVHALYDSSANQVRIWRAENDAVDVSSAPAVAWGTDLAWDTEETVGESSWLIQKLSSHGGVPWVAKEDSVWYRSAGKWIKLDLGFDAAAGPDNGLAFGPWKLFVYFGFGHTLEQIFEGNVVDMGPWLHAGLPSGRTGIVADVEGIHAYMFVAIDGGVSDLSSVQAWNERGYHETFRGWATNRRIQEVKWQACPGTRPRLWMSVGGETMVQEWPKNTLNSLNDVTYVYHHECYVTQGRIDMKSADLPKLFKDLTVASENLTNAVSILPQYQIDEKVGSADWNSLEAATSSPLVEQEIGEGQRSRIQVRHVMRTADADVPPVLLASVLEGMGRTPTKYQWVFTVPMRSLAMSDGGTIVQDPDEFVEWLKSVATQARLLRLNGPYKSMDDVRVITMPPQIARGHIDERGQWDGTLQVAVRVA